MKLNLGCGRNIMPGWINVDSMFNHGVNLVRDLDNVLLHFPYEDNTVDDILLSHVIEHLHRPLPLMQALYRIAEPGCRLVIRCPYGSSDDADEDPTHVRRMFKGSFGYFGQPYYWRADYGYKGDWEVDKITLFVKPSLKGASDIPAIIDFERNAVREMVCEMHAVKPIRAPLRELQVYPNIVIDYATY